MEKKLDISDYKVGIKLSCIKGFRNFSKGNIYTVINVDSEAVWVEEDMDCNCPFCEDDFFNLVDCFEIVEEPEFKVEAVYRVIKDTEWLKVGDIVRTVIVDLETNTIKVQGGKSSYVEWFNICAKECKVVSRDLKNYLERIEEKQEELKVNKFEELFKEVGKETVKNTIFGKLTKVKDGIDFEDWVAENIDISKIPHNLSYDEVLDTYKCYLSDAYREGRRVWYQKQAAREEAKQDRAEFKRLSKKLGKCNS